MIRIAQTQAAQSLGQFPRANRIKVSGDRFFLQSFDRLSSSYPRKTMENKFFDLADAVENLVVQIQKYKSDTWDPNGLIDRADAEAMAAWIIRSLLFDENGVPGDAIDGAEIGCAWDNVQEAKRAIVDSL